MLVLETKTLRHSDAFLAKGAYDWMFITGIPSPSGTASDPGEKLRFRWMEVGFAGESRWALLFYIMNLGFTGWSMFVEVVGNPRRIVSCCGGRCDSARAWYAAWIFIQNTDISARLILWFILTSIDRESLAFINSNGLFF